MALGTRRAMRGKFEVTRASTIAATVVVTVAATVVVTVAATVANHLTLPSESEHLLHTCAQRVCGECCTS